MAATRPSEFNIKHEKISLIFHVFNKSLESSINQ